ncbi:MAG: ParB/RepB/Spo0J family partition protein [Candidatus Nanopelagicales bacterium]
MPVVVAEGSTPATEKVIDLRPTPPAVREEPMTESAAGLQYREIPLDQVVPNPRQPRQVFDDDAISELVQSITTVGLLQPIVVRPAEQGFELVAGERRLRAGRLAGLTRIPALIRQTDDDVMLRDALLENLHRVQLNPLEEAAAYSQLMSDFDCTQEELAQRVGRSRPQVANTLRLLKLPPTVQRRVAAGVLSAGHARAILAAGDADRMEQLAMRVVAEGLSVRAVEELVLVDDAAPDAKKRRSRKTRTPVEYREAADRLADRLETRVRIEGGSGKGRIVVEFGGVDDLARIVDQILTEPRD